jgi:Ca2+-binding EF-hand superfamily protein
LARIHNCHHKRVRYCSPQIKARLFQRSNRGENSNFISFAITIYKQIISDLDKNNDGIISFAEFLEIIAAETVINKENGGHVLRAVFKQFVEDENGTISAVEIQKLLKKLGDNLSDKEVNEIIRGVDSDGDGKIDYEEFLNMLL